jgi:hypothetical protein
VTNYGTLAILALPKMPERQLRLLLALETVTPREGGWREVGTDLLASKAGLSVNTTARARRELAKSGAIDYERGDGRGHVSTYRMKVPHDVAHLPEPGKVPTVTDHLSSPGKVPNDTGHLSGPKGDQVVGDLSEPGKVPKQALERYPNGPRKGGSRNPATSANASGGLEPSGLEPSALPRAARPARDPRTLLLGLGADERESELITARMEADPSIRDPWFYLLTIVGNDDGPAWLDRMRRDLAAQDPDDDPRPPRPPKPPWCGQCDEQTRMVELHGQMARCLRCHPLSVQPPQEPASSIWLKPWCGKCDPVSRWAEVEQPDGTVKLERCPDCGERR